MQTHAQIDQRSRRLAEAVVAKIERQPSLDWRARVQQVCQQWRQRGDSPVIAEWLAILQRPWPEVRQVLLDHSETNRRLRQSDPFCGILTPQERWQVYREGAARAPSRS